MALARTIAALALMMAGAALCSCSATYPRLRSQRSGETGLFAGNQWGRAAESRGEEFTEHYGVKLICSWMKNNSAPRSVSEYVPAGLGVIYREHRESGPQVQEYSIELHQWTYHYWVEPGIKRRVRTEMVRLVFSPLFTTKQGFYAGVGLGGRFGSLKIKDADHNWVPAEEHRSYIFVVTPFAQGKAGFDTGAGFYIEGAVTFGLGLTILGTFGAELSIGFYF